jgi:two-component system nitrogen regulation sensor histidine kinase NtrY
MLAIKVEKVLGQPYMKVLKDEHLPVVNELLESLLESKNGSTQRQVVIPLASEELTLMVHASMLKDHSGEYLGLVVVFDDLTQLQKMQRMAAWREVARRIAHEIKNPLTPIQLSAQRLRRRYLDRLEDAEVFDECTRVIISQVDEMKHLVDEFSAFAKMPSSQLVPDDLNAVVSDSVVLYRQAHPEIDFAVETAADLPRLDLDRSQLSRAIGNLLENAANAVHDSDGGEKRIIARTLYDAQLHIATLEIIDSGPGIPASVKKRIFEPYFSTKKGKGGTGLGLSIVNRIVTDHGGFVRVRDNQPRGSVFAIELPAKE